MAMTKTLCLGTAMWGWSVETREALAILDDFYEAGGRWLDTATNYPMDGEETSRFAAEHIVADWLRSRKISDLQIIYKLGATVNGLSDRNDLSPKFLRSEFGRFQDQVQESPVTAMIHWDNREDKEKISETLEALADLGAETLGLSGIRFPKVYADCLKAFALPRIVVEVKHNFLTSSLDHYRPVADVLPMLAFAYGISGSGLKLNKTEYRSDSYVTLTRKKTFHEEALTPERQQRLERMVNGYLGISSLYQLGIVYAEETDNLYGMIVSPSSREQMKDILEFVKKLPDTPELRKELNGLRDLAAKN